MDDELAMLRKRKLAQRQSEQGELQEQIAQLDAIVKAKLSREALGRYSNVKVAHQELWLQSVVVLAQLIQTRKLDTISDDQYKQILAHLQPKQHDIKIRNV